MPSTSSSIADPAHDAASEQRASIAPCPVEKLAVEAARVLRAMQAMGHDDLRNTDTANLEREAFPAWAAFESQADGPAPEYVAKSLFNKAEAMRELAMHFRASSTKGALFQIYIAGSKASWISGHLVEGRLHKDDVAKIHTIEEHCDHLLHSAASALEALLEGDADIPLLRRWYFDPRLHAATVIDEAIALSQPRAA